VTRSHKAEASNYPFCTIEPNMGIVTVPDPRLEQLAKIFKVSTQIPAVVEFVDIAGLVKGASKGEGLGNKFLSHIREVDAIVHVVRCFEDENIQHVTGELDPVRDIEIVLTELILADLESLHKKHEKLEKDAKRCDKAAIIENAIVKKIEAHLFTGKPANTLNLYPEERLVSRNFFLLTDKPTLFAANLKDSELATADANPHVFAARKYALTHHGCETVVVSAQIESDLADLTPAEAQEFMKELSITEPCTDLLIRSTYHLLGLRTFFTHNEKEVRAWTIHAGDTAPKAAGTVHTDFEKGFIKAEMIPSKELIQCGSIQAAREKGHFRLEGKEYQVQDGDVLQFKFHV